MKINRQQSKNLIQAELKQQIEQNKGWYFITLVRDFPQHRPYGFTINGRPFVLLTNTGKYICYLLPIVNECNICNKLELQSFPVIEQQGIIWLWLKKNVEADPKLIPTLNAIQSGQSSSVNS